MSNHKEMHDAFQKYRLSQFKAGLVLIVGILLLFSGSIIIIVLGVFLLFTGAFLGLQIDKPKPPPHGDKPSPPCPVCSTPLIYYPDVQRYYCNKCVKWYTV